MGQIDMLYTCIVILEIEGEINHGPNVIFNSSALFEYFQPRYG